MGLTKTAITRPVFIFMMMVAAILMGTIAYRSMRVEQNPDVQFGFISVVTIYPGAGPDEINTLVSRKIEEAISGVNGLLEVTSTSQEGVSVVGAQFNVGTDMNNALNDVRAKVDGILNRLPRAVEKPTIQRFDTTTDPILRLILRSKDLNNQQLRDLADDKLKDRFAAIDGVASVIVSGGDEREIQVQVRKDKLLAYGIGIDDVRRAVQNAALNLPSGRIVSDEREYSVRMMADYGSVDEIKEVRVNIQDPKRQGSSQAVRLGDIAEVTDSVKERRVASRLNGSDAVSLSIQKAKEGNAVNIAHQALKVKEQLEQQYGLEMIVTFDQSKLIEESLFDLNFTLFFGIFLVTSIVYVFLHNFRGTLIVGIAIPLCLFATFVVLWTLGFTINNMTMLALSLAIGVLVDDAIVVLENIYRHLKLGEEPKTAALNGRGEIGLAAIAITLADVVVWVPIAFMGGIVGQFFRPLGVGFAVCVMFSLFVSFTVTPMLASRWYRKGEDVEHPTGWFARWFEKTFAKFENAYRRSLEWSLKHRWFVFVSGFVALFAVFIMIGGSFAKDVSGAVQTGMPMLMFAVMIGVVIYIVNLIRGAFAPGGFKMADVLKKTRFIGFAFLFGLVFVGASVVGFKYAEWKGEPIFKFQFFPPSDSGQISIRVELPPGASLAETLKVVERIEQIVMKHPDAKYTVANVGTRSGGFGASDQGTNYGQVSVTLNDKKAILDTLAFWVQHKEALRSRADTAVAADMLEAIGKVPGAAVTVSVAGAQGFGAPIQMSFASDDRELLLKTVNKIHERLLAGDISGVVSPEISSKSGKPEIRALPDRARLADAGLTAQDVAGSMRVLYEGNNDTKFRVRGREYDIRVMMSLEDRNNPAIVSQLPVTFVQGKPVYLSEVTKVIPAVGVDKVERRNREEEIRITADLLPGYAAGTVQQEINDWLKAENLLPEGVKLKPLGQADVQARETGYLFGALLLGLVLVYMLLASLYDNLLYPFIIQLAQPQAMVGALLALIITDKTLNIVGFVGIIALVGLVGKNAILLVDYTNTLRGRGRDRHDALVEAGPVRLRPIMMTTLAVILGMLPVALAVGRGSEFRETIGITIIGGVVLSTLLTLLVIPCSYTIFDDMSNALGRLLFKRYHTGPEATYGPPVLAGEEEEEKAPR